MARRTSTGRVVLAFLACWLTAPLLVALALGLASGLTDPRPGETLLDPVLKMLIYGVVIGVPYTLAIMVVIVAPLWFFLHRGRAGPRGFALAGAIVGALLGLLVMAMNGGAQVSPAGTIATLLVPLGVGALCALLLQRIAYARSAAT